MLTQNDSPMILADIRMKGAQQIWRSAKQSTEDSSLESKQ
jgi:hypothetical protein